MAIDKDLQDALDFAAAHCPPRSEANTEIQHPTDLIGSSPYFELVLFLMQLKVLPYDVHLITSKFWDDYGY
jgi:hypothetical protein